MIIFSRYFKQICLLAVLTLGIPTFAIDLGLVGQYSKNSDSLVVNGRNISISSSGIGLEVSDTVFKEYLYLSAGALYGSTGDASATFSGAAVSGPAKLTTTYGVIKAYAFPDNRWTPLAYYSILSSNGGITFSGYRNTTLAVGSANFSYDQQAYGIGLRFLVIPDLSVEFIAGKHHWKLLSDATGTLGTLGVSTNIEATNTDTFNAASLRYKNGNWTYSGEYGAYVLRSDNQVSTSNFKLAVNYRF